MLYLASQSGYSWVKEKFDFFRFHTKLMKKNEAIELLRENISKEV